MDQSLAICFILNTANTKTWDLRSIDGPFTVAKFFTLNTNVSGDQTYHLFVATALELAVVFWWVLNKEQIVTWYFMPSGML